MKQLNNKGFSLVEVILAVLIFAILVVPIANQFSVIANQTKLAKTKQYGVSLAEDEMEEFKSIDMEALARVYKVDPSNTAKYVLPDDWASNPVVDEYNLQDFCNKYSSYTMDSDGVCTFHADNVASGRQKYSVEVKLDPNDYKGTSSYDNFNTTKQVAIHDFDSNTASIFGTNVYNKDLDADQELWQQIIDKCFTSDEIAAYTNDSTSVPTRISSNYSMTRKLIITIRDNPAYDSTSKNYNKAKYVVSYEAVYTAKVPNSGVADGTEFTKEVTFANQYFNTVPNVYFFYSQYVTRDFTKHKNGTAGVDSVKNDTIEFNNQTTGDSKLYLVYNSKEYADSGYALLDEDGNEVKDAENNTVMYNGSRMKFNKYYSTSICTTGTNKPDVFYMDLDGSNTDVLTCLKLASGFDSSTDSIKSITKDSVDNSFDEFYKVTITVTPNNNSKAVVLKGSRGQ